VADVAPAEHRSTAFGVFNLFAGGALLAASVLAGWLWDAFGPAAAFWFGAAISAVAVVAVLAGHVHFSDSRSSSRRLRSTPQR
jgi:MFS family permease